MTPQFVDLNGDQFNDIIAATFTGEAFILHGSKEGYGKAEKILDKAGEPVRISMYWDDEVSNYRHVDRNADGSRGEGQHMTSIAAVDWDTDGDFDLLLGGYEGGLYLLKNEGSAKKPAFAEKHVSIKVGGKPLQISGGLTTPRVADFNDDGLFDIFCGGVQGGVFYFENSGDLDEPKFDRAVTLIEPLFDADAYQKAEMALYDSAVEPSEDEIAALEAMTRVPCKDGEPLVPGKSYHIEVFDYDNDGDMDLIVGGSSDVPPVVKELTKDEEAKLKLAKKEMEKLEKKMDQYYQELGDSPNAEDFEKIMEKPEVQKLSMQMEKHWQVLEELEPFPMPVDRIWFFENKGVKAIETPKRPGIQPRKKQVKSDSGSKPEAKPKAGRVEAKVAIDATFMETGNPEELTLEIRIVVPEGYHIYGAKNPTSPTSIEFVELTGLQASGNLAIPDGRRVVDAGKAAYWLEGELKLVQKFKLTGGSSKAALKGELNYMMCNEQGCRPPATLKFSAKASSN